jgi:flavin-dependent dehydrogenase
MDVRLLRRAREAGARVLEEATVAGVVVEGGVVRGVRLQGERGAAGEHRARVIIDATGRARAVARRAARELGRGGEGNGAKARRSSLVAFKSHMEGAAGAAGACEIYFYPGGYGGLSPVEGGLSNLCFIARSEDVRARGGDAERVVHEVLMRNRRAAETLGRARARGGWLAVALEGFGRSGPAPAPGLLAAGDAAAFIDPFTGSGMLMALESGRLAAQAVSEWLPFARGGRADFASLARNYTALYGRRFDARLRVCGALRRAAFAPTLLAELTVRALGASSPLRRRLARATRGL